MPLGERSTDATQHPRPLASRSGAWLDGRRSVTIATALGWSGALGESVGAWFAVRLYGHRTSAARMATSRITALPTRSRRVRGSARASGGCRMVRGVFDVHVTFKPTRTSHTEVRVARDLILEPETPRTFAREDNANHRPRPRRTTGQHQAQPTPPTPLGADRPRWHDDHRLNGTPEQARAPGARYRPGPPRDQRPMTSVLGGPLPVPRGRHRVVGVVGQQQQCYELQRLCVIDQFRRPNR
jgi:hypothetical protein